jgi:CubicO group peptidase (beta-lactamase class C family)
MESGITHLTFSITKSVVGLLAEQLISEGVLAETDRAQDHVPELAGTAFGPATVRDLLDMRDGVPFDETYADPAAEIHAYSKAWWGVSPAAPIGALAALRALPARGGAGAPFSYRTPVADVLGLVIARAAGAPLARLTRDRIWRPIGAEHDAWFLLDRAGQEIAGAGLGATLRDLVRLARMLLDGGRVGDVQVVPPDAMARMAQGGCRAAFAAADQPTRPGWSYRSQWWRTHDFDSYCALGVFGQRIWIAPRARTAVVRLGSHPVASNAQTDRLHALAFTAVANRSGLF